MAGIRRYEPKLYGVICDTCNFHALLTRLGSQSREEPHDRSSHCSHPNAQDGYFIDDCPNWLRSVKNGHPLDADGNLQHP